MKGRVVSVLLAAVAVYVFGFLYWGLSPFPYMAWKQPPDEAAARQALRQHFPVSGTYYLPSRASLPAEREPMFKQGPVGFVHIDVDGRPMHDVSIMIRGFILTVMICALIATILSRVAPALPDYTARVGFITLLGATASLLHDGGDTVWWALPEGWQAAKAAYNVGAWIVAGLVLARSPR
jgi:hypothetical protein